MATLTKQQITGLNAAATRRSQGTANPTDLQNLSYAEKTYGYKAPTASPTQTPPTPPPTVTPGTTPTVTPPPTAAPTGAVPFAGNINPTQQAGINNLVSSGRAFNETDAKNFAYSIGKPQDFAKYVGQTGSSILTSMGSAGKLPTPTTTLPAKALTTSTEDLSKILGVDIPAGSVDSTIAGLLAAQAKSGQISDEVTKNQNDLLTAMKSLGGESADLQAEFDKQGVNAAYDHVKELNVKAAQLQGELDKFDVETQQGLAAINDQPIPTGLILGQRGQYEQQRNLAKLARTADLTATIALSQAYQGNAELGIELAGKAVDLKYQPILNNIDVLKTQLGFATQNMSAKDNARAKVIDSLLTLRQNEINTQKDQEKQIQTLAAQAAANGAPLSVVNTIRAAPDIISATQAGASYIKGTLESPTKAGATGGGSTGSGSTKSPLTKTQLQTGAANANMGIADFSKLQPDVQNFFARNPKTADGTKFIDWINQLKSELSDGTTSKEEATSLIDQSSFPQAVKDYLLGQISSIAPAANNESNQPGIFSGIGKALGDFWNTAKSFFTATPVNK